MKLNFLDKTLKMKRTLKSDLIRLSEIKISRASDLNNDCIDIEDDTLEKANNSENKISKSDYNNYFDTKEEKDLKTGKFVPFGTCILCKKKEPM